MQRHEFWLKDHEWSGKYGQPAPGEDRIIYRLALRELIDASERTVFKPPWGSHSQDFWNKSGSVGFMDLSVRDVLVPKEGAVPYPNPNSSPYLEDDYSYEACEIRRVLMILVTGIEPEYRRRGYAGQLRLRAEEIAREWGLDTLVADHIENPDSRKAMVRLGYQLFDHGLSGVKRLRYLPSPAPLSSP